MRGRLTYVQPRPTEDKLSKLISLLTKLLALRVELFCPVVYECDAWVPLLNKVFCFSDKEVFISFELYLFILLLFFLSVWLSRRTLHSSFSEQPRKNRVSVKVRLGVGVGVGFSLLFFFWSFRFFNFNFFLFLEWFFVFTIICRLQDREVKNNQKIIKLWGPKSGRGRLRRWSFTRGSNCKDLPGKVLVFCIGGRLWEVVAYKRCGRTCRFDCISETLIKSSAALLQILLIGYYKSGQVCYYKSGWYSIQISCRTSFLVAGMIYPLLYRHYSSSLQYFRSAAFI